MVEHPGEYRWSSYAANGQGRVDPLISPHVEYLRLEKDSEPRLTAYRELFRQQLDSGQVEEIRASLNHELVFGSSRFKDEIEVMTGRRSRAGKPGRPKRE
jgi:putative transposase